MDLIYLGVAVIMALSAYGLLMLCQYLFRDSHGERP